MHIQMLSLKQGWTSHASFGQCPGGW